MRMPLALALAASPAALAAQHGGPPPPVVSFSHVPPVVSTPPERRLLAWMPGEVRCGGEAVEPTLWRRPALSLGWSSSTRGPAPFRFRIDAEGRAVSIASTLERNVYIVDGEDIAPSLAATRFVSGRERTDCTVTYTTRSTAFADTPLPDLVSFSLDPRGGALPPEGWAVIFAGATCDDDPKPAPLVQAYPDYERLPGTPGVRDWTMVAYDTDALGRPRNLRTLTGTGNTALDRAARDGVARSRYTNGPRTGCRLPFSRTAGILPAPPLPEMARWGAAEPRPGCAGEWVTRPPLRFPEAYRRRGIEGWAVIGYDIAPWGGTGNVRVLASEPTADFGRIATAIVQASKRRESDQGATGCVERVRFRMDDGTAPAVTADPPPPF